MARTPADSPREGRTGGGPDMGALAGAGTQFAASILVFLFAGMWLDRRLGTAPWLLVAGAVVGGTAGFWSMYRTLVVAPRRRAAAAKSKTEGSP